MSGKAAFRIDTNSLEYYAANVEALAADLRDGKLSVLNALSIVYGVRNGGSVSKAVAFRNKWNMRLETGAFFQEPQDKVLKPRFQRDADALVFETKNMRDSLRKNQSALWKLVKDSEVFAVISQELGDEEGADTRADFVEDISGGVAELAGGDEVSLGEQRHRTRRRLQSLGVQRVDLTSNNYG